MIKTLLSFQIVKFKKGGLTFEILCKPGQALAYREGHVTDADEVLASTDVFKSHTTGDKPTSAELMSAFDTDDSVQCAKRILEHGELQLSTEERKRKVEEKRKAIVNHVHKYYVDPKTKIPHPITRIESAMASMKGFNVKFDVAVERQIADFVKRLPDVGLPSKKMELEGTLIVPNSFIGASQSVIQRYLTVRSEKYDKDNCSMEVAIVPGDLDQCMKELNNVTKGAVQFDIVNQQQQQQPTEEKGGKGGKGGGGKGKKGKK